MAKQKTINQQAKVGNEDLTATFRFIKTGTDGYGVDTKELAFALHIQHDVGPDGHGKRPDWSGPAQDPQHRPPRVRNWAGPRRDRPI